MMTISPTIFLPLAALSGLLSFPASPAPEEEPKPAVEETVTVARAPTERDQGSELLAERAGGEVLVAQATAEAAASAATKSEAASAQSAATDEGGRDAPDAAESEAVPEAAPEASGGRVSDEARPVVERVQAFYENTNDFSASFQQTYTYQVGREVRSSGTVAFKKPAMMRWDYEVPRERSFVVDGKDLWIWTPEDFSVVRQQDFTASDLSTSITFLWGEGRLEDEFHIDLEGENVLKLTPIRPDSSFQGVRLEVDPETGRVLESTVIDPQGNRNHMVFSDMRLNTGLEAARFSFQLPEGADLQEMPSMH